MQGRRAASLWAWRESLSAFGATPDLARVVRDAVISGGGVTAGIDMPLAVMAEIAGEDYAQSVQPSIEYAPAPPFSAGRPETGARTHSCCDREALRCGPPRARRGGTAGGGAPGLALSRHPAPRRAPAPNASAGASGEQVSYNFVHFDRFPAPGMEHPGPIDRPASGFAMPLLRMKELDGITRRVIQ
jgi:hypothetical protein